MPGCSWRTDFEPAYTELDGALVKPAQASPGFPLAVAHRGPARRPGWHTPLSTSAAARRHAARRRVRRPPEYADAYQFRVTAARRSRPPLRATWARSCCRRGEPRIERTPAEVEIPTTIEGHAAVEPVAHGAGGAQGAPLDGTPVVAGLSACRRMLARRPKTCGLQACRLSSTRRRVTTPEYPWNRVVLQLLEARIGVLEPETALVCGRMGISAATRRSSSPSAARVLAVTLQHGLLVKEVALVVERRHVGQIDAGERQRPTLIEGLERRHDEGRPPARTGTALSSGSGGRSVAPAGPGRPQRPLPVSGAAPSRVITIDRAAPMAAPPWGWRYVPTSRNPYSPRRHPGPHGQRAARAR